MGILSLNDVNKYFQDLHAVKDVSFEVADGEFVSLLGPSGCGKTTTLRMIAGFEEVSGGSIQIAGRDVTQDPPFKRNTGMVFQNYALFPHMTVEENISFGLRMRKFPKAEIPERVQRALTLIQLEGYEERYPDQLSGGQQQRIALARALAIEPAVLLLDEPLSNLDAKLREEMRIEIRRIQKRVGITSLFVTHDQEEALTLSDRIMVMHEGRIVESGTPLEIYSQPHSQFAASFIGHSNAFQGTLVERDDAGDFVVETDRNLVFRSNAGIGQQPGDEVLILIRQERMRLYEDGNRRNSGANRLSGEVLMISFLGPMIEYICQVGDHELRVRRPNEGSLPQVEVGSEVRVEWDPADCIVLSR